MFDLGCVGSLGFQVAAGGAIPINSATKLAAAGNVELNGIDQIPDQYAVRILWQIIWSQFPPQISKTRAPARRMRLKPGCHRTTARNCAKVLNFRSVIASLLRGCLTAQRNGGPKDHINLQIMISGMPPCLAWALGPECRILMFMSTTYPLPYAIYSCIIHHLVYWVVVKIIVPFVSGSSI